MLQIEFVLSMNKRKKKKRNQHFIQNWYSGMCSKWHFLFSCLSLFHWKKKHPVIHIYIFIYICIHNIYIYMREDCDTSRLHACWWVSDNMYAYISHCILYLFIYSILSIFVIIPLLSLKYWFLHSLFLLRRNRNTKKLREKKLGRNKKKKLNGSRLEQLFATWFTYLLRFSFN